MDGQYCYINWKHGSFGLLCKKFGAVLKRSKNFRLSVRPSNLLMEEGGGVELGVGLGRVGVGVEVVIPVIHNKVSRWYIGWIGPRSDVRGRTGEVFSGWTEGQSADGGQKEK